MKNPVVCKVQNLNKIGVFCLISWLHNKACFILPKAVRPVVLCRKFSGKLFAKFCFAPTVSNSLMLEFQKIQKNNVGRLKLLANGEIDKSKRFGIDLDARYNNDMTAFHLACNKDSLDVTETLIEKESK